MQDTPVLKTTRIYNIIKSVLTKKTILNSAVLATSTLITSTMAQDVEPSVEKKEFEIISVTAQKRSQSIQEVPMTISAFSSDEMDELGIENTTDLANVVPGFNFSETAFGPPVYTIRGVGFNESSAQATSTVGVYIDEVAIPFPIMTKGTNIDVERVEIMKGPQGTLFGRNSTAGAINYIAGKPSDSFEAKIKGTVSSYETISTEGFITGSISDTINGRFAIKAINSDKGWQESISRDETLGRQDKLAVKGSLSVEIGSNTSALLSAAYSTDNSETVAPQNFDWSAAKAGNLPFTAAIHAGALNPEIHPENFTALSKDPQAADWTAGRTPAVDHETTMLSLNIEHEFSNSIMFTSLTGISNFKDNGSEYERFGYKGVTIGEIKNNPLNPVLVSTIEALTGGA